MEFPNTLLQKEMTCCSSAIAGTTGLANMERQGNENFAENTKIHSNSVNSEFLLTCIGYAIGLGNIWRFPYLWMKNGQGHGVLSHIVQVMLLGLICCIGVTNASMDCEVGYIKAEKGVRSCPYYCEPCSPGHFVDYSSLEPFCNWCRPCDRMGRVLLSSCSSKNNSVCLGCKQGYKRIEYDYDEEYVCEPHVTSTTTTSTPSSASTPESEMTTDSFSATVVDEFCTYIKHTFIIYMVGVSVVFLIIIMIMGGIIYKWYPFIKKHRVQDYDSVSSEEKMELTPIQSASDRPAPIPTQGSGASGRPAPIPTQQSEPSDKCNVCDNLVKIMRNNPEILQDLIDSMNKTPKKVKSSVRSVISLLESLVKSSMQSPQVSARYWHIDGKSAGSGDNADNTEDTHSYHAYHAEEAIAPKGDKAEVSYSSDEEPEPGDSSSNNTAWPVAPRPVQNSIAQDSETPLKQIATTSPSAQTQPHHQTASGSNWYKSLDLDERHDSAPPPYSSSEEAAVIQEIIFVCRRGLTIDDATPEFCRTLKAGLQHNRDDLLVFALHFGIERYYVQGAADVLDTLQRQRVPLEEIYQQLKAQNRSDILKRLMTLPDKYNKQ